MFSKEEFFKIIQSYNIQGTEQSISWILGGSPKKSTYTIDEIVDSINNPSVSALMQYKNNEIIVNEKGFWNTHKENILSFLLNNSLNGEEFLMIQTSMEIIRGKYLMKCNYTTIEPEYQEMIQLYISLLLKKHTYGIEKYLRYFDPNTAYYKRIKALTLFRFLKNPKEEIEGLCPEVSNLLYDAIKKDTNSTEQSLNVLKEYIERVFSLTRTTKQSRIEFIGEQNFDSWYQLCGIQNFYDWIRETTQEIYPKEENSDLIQEELTTTDKQFHESEDKKALEEKIKKLEKQSEESQKDYKTLYDQLQKIQVQQSEKDQNFAKILQAHEQQLQDKENTIQSLLNQIVELKKISFDFIVKEKENPVDTSIKTEANEKSKTKTLSKEELQEKRQYYKILVIGGSEKSIKVYKKALKDAKYQQKVYDMTGIDMQHCELKGNYDKQHDKNFVKGLENQLLLGQTDFILAFHTDHETAFANLINNAEFTNRITFFGEREDNNGNPRYSQGFSQDAFIYYLNKACEKYEREQQNSNL